MSRDDDDDWILAEAQRTLEANRERARVEPARAAPAAIMVLRGTARAPVPSQDVTEPLEAPDASSTLISPRVARAFLERLGAGRVSPRFHTRALYAVPPSSSLTPAAIERRIREIIPDAFRGVTMDNLASLRNPEGAFSLGAVELSEEGEPTGQQLHGDAAVDALWQTLRVAPKKVVLLGETRAGKTLVGVAILERVLRAGNDRARWIHAPTLQDPDIMARALSSSFLVLDDLGYELNGATATSGWLPQLRGPACKFLGQWYLRRDVRLVVTTFLDFAQMSELYGAGAAARVYEGATVIRLHRD